MFCLHIQRIGLPFSRDILNVMSEHLQIIAEPTNSLATGRLCSIEFIHRLKTRKKCTSHRVREVHLCTSIPRTENKYTSLCMYRAKYLGIRWSSTMQIAWSGQPSFERTPPRLGLPMKPKDGTPRPNLQVQQYQASFSVFFFFLIRYPLDAACF